MNKFKSAVFFGCSLYVITITYLAFSIFVFDLYERTWSQMKIFGWGVVLATFFSPLVSAVYRSLCNRINKKPSAAASVSVGALVAGISAAISVWAELWFPGEQFYVIFGLFAAFLTAQIFSGWQVDYG